MIEIEYGTQTGPGEFGAVDNDSSFKTTGNMWIKVNIVINENNKYFNESYFIIGFEIIR